MQATVGPYSVPPCITHTFDRVLRTCLTILAVMLGVDHVSPDEGIYTGELLSKHAKHTVTNFLLSGADP